MRTQKNKGLTLLEIMIVVVIIALLAAIAIPNLLRSRLSSNEAMAKSTLRAIATAAESYQAANNGNYPTQTTQLTTANPPYLTIDYCDNNNSAATAFSGYFYTCTFNRTAYTVVARPASCNQTGYVTWTITTGSVLTPTAC